MISLCTAVLNNSRFYLYNLLDSLEKKSKLVSEVLICDFNMPAPNPKKGPLEKVSEKRGIKVRRFPFPVASTQPKTTWLSPACRMCHKRTKDTWESNWGRCVDALSHPLGLHECLARATNEHILFVDPDTFFITGYDTLFYELMEKHSLDFVGISHHNALCNAMQYFPVVTCMLTRKSSLPDPSFLKGKLTMEQALMLRPCYPRPEGSQEKLDYFLMCGCIEEIMHEYPNPEGFWDVGIQLHYWCKQTNKKWLAFQTDDIHLYTTKYFRSNCGFKERLPKRELLWHATGSGDISSMVYWDEWNDKYREYSEEDE